MKKIFYLTLSFFVTSYSSAQTIDWVKSYGGVNDDEVTNVTADDAGFSYTTGVFSGTVDFDPGIGSTVLNSFGGTTDAFLCKYNSDGDFQWVHHFSGPDSEATVDAAVDDAGAVYVIGSFYGSINVDPGVSDLVLTSNGDYDIFVVKLNADGSFSWGRNIGAGAGADDFGNTIDMDDNSSLFIGGQTNGSGDFDPGVNIINLNNMGGYDAFISRYNTSGDCLWVKQYGGPNDDNLRDLDVRDAYVYATGSFRSTVDFDPSGSTMNLTSTGGDDIFVLKTTLDGNTAWAKSMGGAAANDIGKSIVVDAFHSVYTVGQYSSFNADFDPGPGSVLMTPVGGIAAFISKLDQMGTYAWAKQFSGSGSNTDITSAALTSDYELLLAGSFTQTVDFNPSTSVYSIASQGGADMFIARLSGAGAFVSAQSHGGNEDDKLSGISVNASDIVYTGGYYTTSAAFYSNPVQMISGAGLRDACLLKLSSCELSTGTDIQESCGTFTWIDGVTYTASNNTATYTLTNMAGCDSVVTLNLTIYPVPGVQVSGSGDTYSATTAGMSYQWIDCATNYAIVGATNQTFTATENGTYAVIVDNGNCSDTSSCVTVSGLGMNEHSDISVLVSPNPVSDLLNIESSHDGSAELTDAFGKTILIITLEKGINSLDFSNLTAGVYFVVTQNKSVKVLKL